MKAAGTNRQLKPQPYMTSTQKAVLGATGVLLLGFVVFGIYTWIRVLQVIPYSSNCATTLVQISQQSSKVQPFFLVSLLVSAAVFEFSHRKLPRGWRFAYLITLGLGVALLVAPWLVASIYS